MTSPKSTLPPFSELPARERFVRGRGLLQCCLAMLDSSSRPTHVGSEAECPVCHAVVRVDEAGAWTWQPVATAEVLRKWSVYG